MEKRKISVPSVDKARGLIDAFAKNHNLKTEADIKLVWIYPDLIEKDDAIGCPCFACDCKKKLSSNKIENGLVYVKAFATQNGGITKFISLKKGMVAFFEEIAEGEEFSLKDKQNRFPEQNYRFLQGMIVEKP